MPRKPWRDSGCEGDVSTRQKQRLRVGSAALAIFFGLFSGAAAAHTALPLSACRLPGIARPARCGALDVPEDPGRPDGRKIPIHIARIPASSGKSLPDPIAVLMGGPGESAIEAATLYAKWLAPLLKDRDLLLVDQRGTGKSAPLNCDFSSPALAADELRDFFPLAAVRSCRGRLEKTADLKRYTYLYFAKDLEGVRRALGYGPLNLFAGSYGTRAAQVYLRMYPHSVRTAYLGSVVPVDIEGPLDFARTEQTALERMFANCNANLACHRAFPHVRSEWNDVIERLQSGKMRVSLPGHAKPVPLGRGRVVEWVRSQLYRPANAAALPWIIHRAFTGDWAPVVDGILSNGRHIGKDISLGLFFSVVCSEDMPFVRERDVPLETRGTFLGDYRLREQQSACRGWPRSTLPKDYRKAVQTGVPTLFVTGDQDGGTPLWFTDRVARRFSSRAIIVVRGQGHTEWNGCVARLYATLVRSASVRGLEARPCPAIPLPPFKT
ncbi:MAG TPA: alpha/beta fold hydrolase [Rhizomicrobium sp.]|nr:alpha/beta fold hydrolase [Rhizomicrobium sp.]